MAQDRILGEQLDINDVAVDIASGSPAINSIASGIATNPTAINSIAVGVTNDPIAIANLEAGIDHNNLINAGSPLHFTETSISHLNITDAGTNTHAMIDAHIAPGSPQIHFTEVSIDHDIILNGTGLYSHGQIDTHVGNNTIHFSTLTGLSDVDTSGVTAGQVLTYSNSPAGWSAQDASGGVTNPLSSDLDVGGFVVQGADVATGNAGNLVIASGASSYAGAGSYAGKVTIKGGDRLYEGDYTGVIPAGSPADFNSISIIAGNGGGVGGDIELVGGTSAASYGTGGTVKIMGGEGTHAINAYSGGVLLQGANQSATYEGASAGGISIIGGNATYATGGDISITSGDSGGYGGAGNITITAGSALLATGSPAPAAQYAGNVKINAGAATLATGTDTPGGDITIAAGNAANGGNGKGGDIILDTGANAGSGAAGLVKVVGELDMGNKNLREVNSVFYRDEYDIGTSTTVQFILRNHIKASPVGATTYAFVAAGLLRTGHYQFKLVDGLNNNPSWPSTVKWQNNTEPTWTANTDIITFYYDFLNGYYYATNVALGFVDP